MKNVALKKRCSAYTSLHKTIKLVTLTELTCFMFVLKKLHSKSWSTLHVFFFVYLFSKAISVNFNKFYRFLSTIFWAQNVLLPSFLILLRCTEHFYQLFMFTNLNLTFFNSYILKIRLNTFTILLVSLKL